jgi:ADP-ribosylglycohydrolase
MMVLDDDPRADDLNRHRSIDPSSLSARGDSLVADTPLEDTLLFKKVYGCLLGGAIGDALGGPVEGWTAEEIRAEFGGDLERYVPYRKPPGYHRQFGEGERLGAYTDDTRMKHLLCEAVLDAGGMPRAGHYAHALARAYHRAPDAYYEGFVEEYYFKAVWGRDKVIFSGEPTNGAIMSNSPLGVMAACRPDAAYQAGFDLAFVTDGYAKTASAMMAAAIAAAMGPTPSVDGVIDATVAAHLAFAEQREGPRWYGMLSPNFKGGAVASTWRYDPNLQFLTKALEIARRERDVSALRDPLYAELDWGHLFSEATHTLVVPMAMFVASGGDFRRSVVGSIMYGRDNESYASVAGALAGAFHGVDAIPEAWIQPVIDGNPEVDMHALALSMTELLAAESADLSASAAALAALNGAAG